MSRLVEELQSIVESDAYTSLASDYKDGKVVSVHVAPGTIVNAQFTHKKWPDGAPVLKHMTGPGKPKEIVGGSMKFVVGTGTKGRAWAYWQEGGTWFGALASEIQEL
jgi:hypothetical protein